MQRLGNWCSYEDVGSIENAGAVNVIYGCSPGHLGPHKGSYGGEDNQYWTQDSDGVKGASEPHDYFGSALASGDFNGDGYDDLAIGVPGENHSGKLNAGMVNVLYGSKNGLQAKSPNDEVWHQGLAELNGSAEHGDEFGSSLAAGDFDGDGYDELAVGIPKKDVNGKVDAGAVQVIYGSQSGLSDVDQHWHQDTYQNGHHVPGVAKAGEQFGFSLAAAKLEYSSPTDALAIGVPYDRVDGVSNAGAVNVIYGNSGSGLQANGSQRWHQNKLQGTSQPGDHFGWSLAAERGILAVGVPHEDVGGKHDAGAVNIIVSGPGSAGLTDNDNDFWHQNKSYVTANNEHGDLFG